MVDDLNQENTNRNATAFELSTLATTGSQHQASEEKTAEDEQMKEKIKNKCQQSSSKEAVFHWALPSQISPKQKQKQKTRRDGNKANENNSTEVIYRGGSFCSTWKSRLCKRNTHSRQYSKRGVWKWNRRERIRFWCVALGSESCLWSGVIPPNLPSHFVDANTLALILALSIFRGVGSFSWYVLLKERTETTTALISWGETKCSGICRFWEEGNMKKGRIRWGGHLGHCAWT